MATSKIILYKTEFPQGENIYVDKLDLYLQSIAATSHIIDNFQYIRHGLDITIKLMLNQSEVNDFDYNYCSITNSDDNIPFYYYIAGASQVAQETVAINLALDTINTLGQDGDSIANPYNFDDRTVIARQHGDRFVYDEHFDKLTTQKLYRRIDTESEGLSFEKQQATDEKIKEEGEELDWYLIYRNRKLNDETTTSNPIDTFLCASKPIYVKDVTTHITASDIGENIYWYYHTDINPGGSLSGMKLEATINRPWTIAGGTTKVDIVVGRTIKCIGLRNLNGQLQYTFIYDKEQYCWESFKTAGGAKRSYYGNNYNFKSGEDITLGGNYWNDVDELLIDQGMGSFYVSTTDAAANNWDWEKVREQFKGNIHTVYPTVESVKINGIDIIDRTDTRILKIIKLPYSPTKPLSITQDASGNDVYDFSDRWSPTTYNNILVSISGKLPQFDAHKINTISWESSVPNVAGGAGYRDAKDDKRESKVYHSDFHTEKITYDSFSKEIKLERIKPTTNARKIDISFKPSSTITSNLGFKFEPQYTTYNKEEDFDQILLAQRNNEEMLMNSAYINYVDTGLNYDKKMNNKAMWNAALGNIANLFGAGVSVAQNMNEANRYAKEELLAGQIPLSEAIPAGSGPFGVFSGVLARIRNQKVQNYQMGLAETRQKYVNTGMLINSIGGLASLGSGIYQTVQLHNDQKAQMCQKLAELESHATSISGSDDIDLMSWYSDNKLWHFTYKIPEYARKYLCQLFDLMGYSHTAIEKPNISSRCNYNFIQCQPFFKPEALKKFQLEYMADLKEKYGQGVTVFHRAPDGSYDFARSAENWESWVVE